MDLTNPNAQPTKAHMAVYMQKWMQWINDNADGGNHLSRQGRLLKPKNQVIDMPYISDHNSVAAYISILASNLDGATKIAVKFPILNGENKSVENREVATPGK